MTASDTAVVATNFLGPTYLYAALTGVRTAQVEIHENYQKRSSRNRAYVLGANGPQLLTVPLAAGKNRQMPIQQVEIAYDHDWIGGLLHTLRSSLGSSAYFEYYYDSLETLLRRKARYLVQLNDSLVTWLLKEIGLSLELTTTASYQRSYTESIDLRKIDMTPIKKDTSYAYAQVWEDRFTFYDNLSIIDLLFCNGPASLSVLQEIERSKSSKYDSSS